VRWYLRFGLPYRDLEELLAERGVIVDHVTLHRWVQRFTPLLSDAADHVATLSGDAGSSRDLRQGCWRVAVRVPRRRRIRPGHQRHVSSRRDVTAARKFFTTTITEHREPEEVITDRAAALANVIEDLVPQALHNTVKYANNRVECDHGRLKARLRPMRG